jgi:hypothetical protein
MTTHRVRRKALTFAQISARRSLASQPQPVAAFWQGVRLGVRKLLVARDLIQMAIASGERALFFRRRRELTNNTTMKLFEVGVDHEIVQAGLAVRRVGGRARSADPEVRREPQNVGRR